MRKNKKLGKLLRERLLDVIQSEEDEYLEQYREDHEDELIEYGQRFTQCPTCKSKDIDVDFAVYQIKPYAACRSCGEPIAWG